MRETEYRAWDKETKKIYKVRDLTFDSHGKLYKISVFVNDYFYQWHDSERYILMQYTGLKDKNGKEIYEGDIVHYCSEDIDVISEIGFDESLLAYAMYSWEGNYIFGYEPPSVFEVIGNIYENPNLVEVDDGN